MSANVSYNKYNVGRVNFAIRIFSDSGLENQTLNKCCPRVSFEASSRLLAKGCNDLAINGTPQSLMCMSPCSGVG